ncbi:hypothetical protein EJB05_12558, partial [Eragrostis curvula]
MFVSPFASLDLALHKDERFSTQDADRKEETFLAQQSSSPSLYLEPLPSSPPCTILIGDQEPLKKENSWAMDFLEASTLEKHDPKHELENFFLEHPQETCSCHESLEPTPLSAKTPLEAYNHLVYLFCYSFFRLPVGRPRVRAPQPWTPEGVPEQLPTATYVWENVGAPYAETERAYVEFSNELDALTPSCVNWWPYCGDDVAAVENGLGLNPLCRRDAALWTMRCPLICFYAVEYHLPIRVMRQFGRQQPFPPDTVSTSIELHKFDRSKQKKVTDFAHHHRAYLDEWRRFEDNCERIHAMHRDSSFRRYLEWYQSSTRYRLRQAWTDRDYADMESSDDENTPLFPCTL